MNFFAIIGITFGVVAVVILISAVIRRSRKRNRAIYQAPIVITSATHTTPGTYPNQMPTVSVSQSSNMSSQQIVYPGQSSCSVIGINPQVTPINPVYAQPNYGMNPPSYETTVGSNQVGYEKQPAYNPSYI